MPLRRRSAAAVIALLAALGLVMATATPANAAWSEWYNRPGQAALLACKKPVDSVYGPLWEITLVAASSPDWSVSSTFQVRRGASVVQHVTLSSRNGPWDVRTTYASRLLGDTWYMSFGVGQISTGQGLGQTLEGPNSFSQIRYC